MSGDNMWPRFKVIISFPMMSEQVRVMYNTCVNDMVLARITAREMAYQLAHGKTVNISIQPLCEATEMNGVSWEEDV
jgi:hypothetical protein